MDQIMRKGGQDLQFEFFEFKAGFVTGILFCFKQKVCRIYNTHHCPEARKYMDVLDLD